MCWGCSVCPAIGRHLLCVEGARHSWSGRSEFSNSHLSFYPGKWTYDWNGRRHQVRHPEKPGRACGGRPQQSVPSRYFFPHLSCGTAPNLFSPGGGRVSRTVFRLSPPHRWRVLMRESKGEFPEALILLGVALTGNCKNHLIHLLSSNKFAKVVQVKI